MHELEGWLADVSNQTLPGGVAVAAVAAAMGAALAAKAIRVTLSHGGLSSKEQRAFEEAAAAVRDVQGDLLALAQDDEAAFRRLLATSKGAAGERDDERREERLEAWDMVIEVPLRIGETCRDLLAHLSPLRASCTSSVLVDLEIGTSLLLAGEDAAVRAARANLQQWKAELRTDPTSGDVARRLEGLERKKT